LKAINSTEHTQIDDKFDEEKIKEFNQLYDKQNPKYLALHQEFDGYEVKLKSYYYIGYRWLDEENKEYIHISPKIHNGYQADYLKIFLICLKDPIVSKHLDETYKIFFNEKWIEPKSSKNDEITPLLILQFLQIVKNISTKGLKKGYVKVTENLTSKVKGKILINQTIKQNHFKNRVDKTVCNHQIFTVNCLENQILKTALLQCSRNLHGINNKEISKLLKLNLNSFELVNSKEVFNSDFAKIKHSPFFKEYKEALKLAQMIFKRFGFNLNSKNTNINHTKIPPFYINMPELFERYVEVKLREKYKDNLKAGYGMGKGCKISIGELRPDFVVKNKKLIIDAKYKYWFKQDDKNSNFKDDFQQLSLYGRVVKIRDDIGLKDSFEEAKILFIYPRIDGKESIDDDFEIENDFTNIYKFGIKIPLQEVEK
jgi:5-methylcytosine-specific restriction endonuclease McrBC regulatory subunit McrC